MMFQPKVFSGLIFGLALLLAALSNKKSLSIEYLPVPVGADPAYLEDPLLLEKAVWRPRTVAEAKDVVLLVHGSGMTCVYNSRSL
jgi:hypothetical protein